MVRPSDLKPTWNRSRWLVVPCLVVAGGLVGCSHKRTALRPAFTTPIVRPAAPACPSGRAVIAAPSAVAEPFASPSIPADVPASAPVTGPATSAEPTAPPVYDPVTPTRLSPPVPTEADEREPRLDLRYSDPGASGTSSSTTSPNDGSSIELTQPKSSRSSSTGRKVRPAGNRFAPVSLRSEAEAVRPFVDHPDDLFQPPKADRPWRYVVLHHSAGAVGGYDRIDREHRKTLGWQGCGYHFVIGNGTDTPDGRIEVVDRWVNQKNGVHCRNGKNSDVNEYGIGICLVGNFDDAPPTARQVEAARNLVAYLGTRYHIPKDRIDTHADLADGPTACPGKHFPEVAIIDPSRTQANPLASLVR